MAPVFSMVLDEDVSPDIALMYPELYRELMKVGDGWSFGGKVKCGGSEGGAFEIALVREQAFRYLLFAT